MAAHGSRDELGGNATLPHAVPFDVPQLSRLSWELGTRVIDGDETEAHSEWQHTGAPWELSLFHVTSETLVARVSTPTGREQFYGIARTDLDSALSGLETAPHWGVTE